MSVILLRDLQTIETLLLAPKNLSLPNKRWHSAFLTVYCSRAFLPRFNLKTVNRTANENKTKLSPSSSYSVINLKTDHPFSIDETTLTELVEEKNLEMLRNLGGVHKVASALETSVDMVSKVMTMTLLADKYSLVPTHIINRLQKVSFILLLKPLRI
ncbi:hypothetical protein L6164_025734 [Bauhinia variegata]|uniref:Uncharacterized protein n=1 Tax=Bauhinia variegata TaxID=167791 RepID=A0ACB9M1K9_BAUVA|nr:hypothetical protein L6164_025734 [Bauhinia variegata]